MTPVRRWTAILLLGSCACGARAAAPPPAAPLFQPGAEDRWIESVRPAPAVRASPTPAPTPPRHRDVLATCSQNLAMGKALCRVMTGDGDPHCLRVCSDAYVAAHPVAPPASSQPDASLPSAPAPPLPAPAPDPYTVALRECIVRVRDSGGAEAPACHFQRPLDQMDFGQRHCDATCADLTADYRGPATEPPREDSSRRR